MLIDWFTVAAQALNFVVLVWLMKRFLYKPVMAAIAAREALVAAELSTAAAKSKSAEEATAQLKQREEAFDHDRAAQVTEATNEAKRQGALMIDAARAQADALQGQRRQALQREMEELQEGLARRAQQAFFALARRAFQDLANSSLEAQVAALFCERLRTLAPQQRATLSAAVLRTDQPAVISAAFELSSDLKQKLEAVLSEVFGGQLSVRYQVAPELVSGIELTAHGQRIGWSIADYLTSLEQGIVAAIPVNAASPRASATATAVGSPMGPALVAAH